MVLWSGKFDIKHCRMAHIIYGVDIESDFSCIDARDAVIRCFMEAHDEVLQETMFSDQTGIDPAKIEQIKRLDVKMLISQMFTKIDGDFEHPDKQTLLRLVEALGEFALSFRPPEVIEKHADEIRLLLSRLPDEQEKQSEF